MKLDEGQVNNKQSTAGKSTPSSHRAAKSTTVNTRWVCFNDPACESSWWCGVVGNIPTTFIQLAGAGSTKVKDKTRSTGRKSELE